MYIHNDPYKQTKYRDAQRPVNKKKQILTYQGNTIYHGGEIHGIPILKLSWGLLAGLAGLFSSPNFR